MEFYLKYETEEHFLLANEVATAFGILTANRKPHSRLVGTLLKQEMVKQNMPTFYYFAKGRGNMLAVYPARIYNPAMLAFLKEQGIGQGSLRVDDIHFSYLIELPEEAAS